MYERGLLEVGCRASRRFVHLHVSRRRCTIKNALDKTFSQQWAFSLSLSLSLPRINQRLTQSSIATKGRNVVSIMTQHRYWENLPINEIQPVRRAVRSACCVVTSMCINLAPLRQLLLNDPVILRLTRCQLCEERFTLELHSEAFHLLFEIGTKMLRWTTMDVTSSYTVLLR